MKVVLLKDVKNMGRAGSVMDVSDGHAMNMLIPRKLAVLATPSTMKRAEGVAAQENAGREVQAALISERLAALSDGIVTITKKANEQGHLYDAVDAKDIATATELPVDAIHLEKPIKGLGTVDVPVAYGSDFGSVKITIEAE